MQRERLCRWAGWGRADEAIHLDMYILKWLAGHLERALPELATYHPELIVDEFERTITRELDFVNEAAATGRFHEAFRDDPNVIVPEVRWDLTGVAIAHRLGRLQIGEASLVVAVSSAHRKEAFEACHFSVDRIKQIVPIWKKEFFEGGEVWVGSQEDFDPLR